MAIELIFGRKTPIRDRPAEVSSSIWPNDRPAVVRAIREEVGGPQDPDDEQFLVDADLAGWVVVMVEI